MRRFKPLLHRKCNGKFKDHAKIVHHLKQSHKIFFHATCLSIFDSRSELEVHLDKEACCRTCRKHFGNRDMKERHILDTTDYRHGREPKPDQATLWQSIYQAACGDNLHHNPYWGPDFPHAEERAKNLYPYTYIPPSARLRDLACSEKSIETDGIGANTDKANPTNKGSISHILANTPNSPTRNNSLHTSALDPVLLAQSATDAEKRLKRAFRHSSGKSSLS